MLVGAEGDRARRSGCAAPGSARGIFGFATVLAFARVRRRDLEVVRLAADAESAPRRSSGFHLGLLTLVLLVFFAAVTRCRVYRFPLLVLIVGRDVGVLRDRPDLRRRHLVGDRRRLRGPRLPRLRRRASTAASSGRTASGCTSLAGGPDRRARCSTGGTAATTHWALVAIFGLALHRRSARRRGARSGPCSARSGSSRRRSTSRRRGRRAASRSGRTVPSRDWVPALVFAIVGFFFVALGLAAARRAASE